MYKSPLYGNAFLSGLSSILYLFHILIKIIGKFWFQEVIIGALSGAILLLLLVPIADSINYWLVTSTLAPLTATSVTFALSSAYPNEGSWTKSWADSVAVIAVPGGFNVGAWLYHHYGFTGTLVGPFPVGCPSVGTICLSLLRSVIGLLCVLLARLIVKKISYKLISLVNGVTAEELKSQKRVAVEMSVKYFTYYHMSLATSFIAPLVFWLFNIDTNASQTDF